MSLRSKIDLGADTVGLIVFFGHIGFVLSIILYIWFDILRMWWAI